MYIIHIKTKTFIEKLFFTKQFIFGLNQNVNLFNWIEILINNSDKLIALNILYSFIQLYFNQNQKEIEQILLSFQHLLLFKLIQQSQKQNDHDENISSNSLSLFIIEYIKYIFNNSTNYQNQLFQEILLGLSVLTKTDEKFHFITIQPIITAVLPLLSEYLIKNPQDNPQFINWLMAKLTEIMIRNSPLDSLVKTNLDQLNSSLFSGGYETSDYQLLFSIYNNTDEGARLILKIKKYLHKKPYLLQKSIEEQANNASASIFVVYIKYFRRLNLVKNDLIRLDNEKVHEELLSLYKYSNSVENLFANRKAQGEDCEIFCKEIQNRCLFLLLKIKENNFIPIIEENFIEKKISFQRQISHWTKAKHFIRLLRHLFNACIRFKKLILPKKNIFNYQNILHENIQLFIFQNNNLDQLQKSLHKQNQRALSRLFAYEFIGNVDNDNLFLIQLINSRLEWSYLENISTANNELKDNIRKCFYSIIKKVLLSSKIELKIVLNFVNINYELDDFIYLYNYKIIEILLKTFVSFIENNEENISLEFKFISFNWFKLFTFKLSENIHQNQILQKLNDFIFKDFIFNHLKQLKRILINQNNDEISKDSLENLTITWFIYSSRKIDNSNKFFSKYEIELCINQFLIILLESIYLYEHVRITCANINYINELLNIYNESKHNSIKIVSLKLLGELIPCLPNKLNDISNNLIEKFLNDSLILQNNIINELINIYRIIISKKSPWQIIGLELILNSIKNNLNNKLIGSLCILGGYIQPFSLNSIVKIYNNKQNEKFQLGIIIEIDSSSYIVQYFDNNQIESVKKNQLEIEIDINPPNLFFLPNSNELIHSIFDKLANSIENESNSLQIKRRSILTLYYLLNNSKLIEIFMEKSYASILSKLTISNTKQQTINLSHFNKQDLEQYSLILEKNFQNNNYSPSEIIRDENLVDYLSTSVKKYNGWKPYVTRREFQLLNQGRLGNNQMSIVPMPKNTANPQVLQECGNKHRFKGKIFSTTENTNVRFATFILENLRVKQGNWYFCVKISLPRLIQIGWATHGFSPGGAYGISDDLYSWSYDGSRATLFHKQEFSNQFDNIHWKENDLLGCGISIDQENINIKYWLNGKLLSTPFIHQQCISSSTNICNLLPNQSRTTYFPGVSLRSNDTPSTTCEFIFSPQDMDQCPLPHGYKPLLMPKIINILNSIVPYPYNAYLIQGYSEDYFYINRQIPSKRFRRDFIDNYHLQTEFYLDEDQLILTENTFGFPLSINNNLSSFTITFHCQIPRHQQNNIQLLTLETLSISIPFDQIEGKTQIVIVFFI